MTNLLYTLKNTFTEETLFSNESFEKFREYTKLFSESGSDYNLETVCLLTNSLTGQNYSILHQDQTVLEVTVEGTVGTLFSAPTNLNLHEMIHALTSSK